MKKNYDFSKGKRGAVICGDGFTPLGSELMKMLSRRTITFTVADHAETTRRVLAAAAAKIKGAHFMTFFSVEAMWRALSPNRWQIIQLMTGEEPMTLREIARRAERDVTASTATSMLRVSGIIDCATDGRFSSGQAR